VIGARRRARSGRAAGAALSVLLAACAPSAPGSAPAPTAPPDPPHVVPVYYIPSDLSFTREALALQVRAVNDVRDWYARRLGGVTFHHDPIVVQRSRHAFAELAANDFQNWWPLPDSEYVAYGMPWNRQSGIKLLVLARGGGAWAGADSENGGIDSIAQAGRVPKGALGGLAVIGDSSTSGVLAGVCPREGPSSHHKPTGGTTWWCNWNTYRGTIAHELGHTWGLPHPDAFRRGFRCDSTVITNMQCHWAWPSDSLLPFEAAHLKSLPGFDRSAAMPPLMLGSVTCESRSSGAPVRMTSFERGDTLVWMAGRGGGTGYLWALTVPAGAEVRCRVPRSGAFIAEVGRPLDDSHTVAYSIEVGGQPKVSDSLARAELPRRVAIPVAGKGEVILRISGPPGARVVFGNARVK
jgi:hypothetical protein